MSDLYVELHMYREEVNRYKWFELTKQCHENVQKVQEWQWDHGDFELGKIM